MKQLAFAAATLSFACAAFCAPPAGFEQRVETARREIGVPGMAIAIVENDKVTFAKGFGTKALGKPEPVDADTIFPTARPARRSPSQRSVFSSIEAGSIGMTR